MWNMSDRGIPRSYRTMEGFGVHTFRLRQRRRRTSLVKFHWKPRLGVHSLVWEEAQLLGGLDPDFHRRDLYDAIESGAYPAWELGVQVFPDIPEQTFEGIDLLDPTKIVPEELAPVQPIGLLTLTATRPTSSPRPSRSPSTSDTCAGHRRHRRPAAAGPPVLLPGHPAHPAGRAELQPDPDQPTARTGQRHAARRLPPARRHAGVAPYRPNSLDGGCPFQAGADEGAFADVPVRVPEASKVRENPASYDDHFSQARLFWTSMTPVEQEHIVNAYSFELGKCYEQAVKERQLLALANIDADLCAQVAQGLGLPAPERTVEYDEPEPSPALSQVGDTWPPDGRTVGIVVDPAADLARGRRLREALMGAGVLPLLMAPRRRRARRGTHGPTHVRHRPVRRARRRGGGRRGSARPRRGSSLATARPATTRRS